MDNAICGGGDPGSGISDTAVPITASAVAKVKAAILLGDPRYVSGLAYGVGTCTSGGVSEHKKHLMGSSGSNNVPLVCCSTIGFRMPKRRQGSVVL